MKQGYAKLLWIGALLMVIGQLTHPSADASEIGRLAWATKIVEHGQMSLIAHISFMIAFPLLFIGLIGLLQAIGTRVAGILAIVTLGLASLAGILAITFNLFVTRSLAINYLAASAEMRPFIDAQFDFNAAVGSWFSLGLFLLFPLAFVGIAVALLHGPATNRVFVHRLGIAAAINSVVGLIAVAGLLLEQGWFAPVEAVFVIGSAIWFTVAGVLLNRWEDVSTQTDLQNPHLDRPHLPLAH